MPFADKTDLQIPGLILKGMRPDRHNEPPLNDEAWKLIQWCWAQVASERPRMKDVAEWMMAMQFKSQAPLLRGRETRSLADASPFANTSLTNTFLAHVSPLTSSSPLANNSPVTGTSPLDNLLMILRRRKVRDVRNTPHVKR